jgi:CHAD domain-containing protein
MELHASTTTADAPAAPPATAPLLAYLDQLVVELHRLVPLALRDWDEHAIHQSRVATRRLKAAIDLFRPVLSDDAWRPFNKITRKLRRRLGPLRDFDVMIGHLAELSSNARHATAVAWLSGQFAMQRDKARSASLEDTAPSKVLGKLGTAWAVLRAEIVEAGDVVDSLLVQSIHLQLDAFAEQADRLLAAPAGGSAEPEVPQDVHQLRIAGKALRYTLEMAREHGRPLDARVMRTFKRMQESLGLWHDFVVMTEWAMRASLDGLLAHHDTELQADVLALARVTLASAEQRLRGFGRLWAKDGKKLAETIRESFPLTQPTTATAATAARAFDAASPAGGIVNP